MNKPENSTESRIPEEIAPEVFALASRYYAEYCQSFSASELVKAGAEVDIPAEFIQKAIQDIEAQRSQQRDRQQRLQQQRRWGIAIAAGVFSVMALWGVWTYNAFSRASARVDAAWAQVENQLQRRADLLPNLVNVTQAYAQHEQSLVTTLNQAHASYLQARTLDEKVAATGQVNQAIAQFYNYATLHPELTSSRLFTNLQYEIAGTENRLAVERMRYNQAVQAYNQTIQVFPNSLVARVFHFQSRPFFKAMPLSSPTKPNQ